ncbi:hypothetical protein BDY17DRAFT_176976 [Neohortaea acidophila]|uniref:Uncharacterized protein n=1 Tax=Neohortaea acidophila TaxID=245834 RepID=A0A6A6PPR6_9PEZI|nr:uncharacterized protein BDY17DRAFT_176976 [Neohortaea acidophila]KAF2482088.1 hypothetical protein BDY17DRAFT_176976 [Neohortaea acidophila]
MATTQASPILEQQFVRDCPSDDTLAIGGFVKAKYLEKWDNNAGWKLKTDQMSTLSVACALNLVSQGVITKDATWPRMSERCVFRDQLTVARGTGFLVHPDGIIATCGHCVFTNDYGKNPEKPPLPEISSLAGTPFSPDPVSLGVTDLAMLKRGSTATRDLEQDRFVFGLTQKYAEKNAPPIPQSNVWAFERVLFGQNGSFDTRNTAKEVRLSPFDRPDWALVRLKPMQGSKLPQPLPLFRGNIDEVVTGAPKLKRIGHHCGNSLKICDTAPTAGQCSAKA